MPNSLTFSIPPIREMIARHGFSEPGKVFLDPFCRESPFRRFCISNDLDPTIPADYHLDALEFMNLHDTSSADGVLFDPPYSPRQVSECYRDMDRVVDMQSTQSSFWGNLKKEIARVLKPEGVCITCGWNSGGVGKGLGMELVEVLLVSHGGWHNDTIVTAEIKEVPHPELGLSL